MESRRLNILAFFFSLLLIIIVSGLNSFLNLAPCPMCQIQHILLAIMAFIYLLAYFHHPAIKGIRHYGMVTFSLAVLGMLMAGRQWWLHMHPQIMPTHGACGSDLFYLFNAFSLKEVASLLWRSAGACEEAAVALFYIPLPAWSFLGFGLLSIVGLIQLLYPKAK
ncbi:MAG: disulfide bond formation protein B [Gammaproteobacteria bacterium]